MIPALSLKCDAVAGCTADESIAAAKRILKLLPLAFVTFAVNDCKYTVWTNDIVQRRPLDEEEATA